MLGKCSATVVLLAILCVVHVSSSALAALAARQNAPADAAAQNANLQHVPTFNTVEELCEWLCVKASPHFDYGCPESCGGMTNPWSKRSATRRRFDDFSFDDYLFMKLLGRNLGDRQ